MNRKRLAVWSAGCSTGEEVYSIATILLEHPDLAGFELLVYGSDISKRCLAHARRAVYGPSSFRVTTPEQKRRWFIEREGGFQVHERVRQICHFGQLNLLEAERAPAVGRVDAIFCRNVLIYLDGRSRKRVIDLFHERLYPGGVLLLGHSESLINVSTAFELLHLRDDLAYRRPLSGFGFSSPRPMRAAPPVESTDEAAKLRDSGTLRDSQSLRDSQTLRDSGSLRDSRTKLLERLARAEERSDRELATKLRTPEPFPAITRPQPPPRDTNKTDKGNQGRGGT